MRLAHTPLLRRETFDDIWAMLKNEMPYHLFVSLRRREKPNGECEITTHFNEARKDAQCRINEFLCKRLKKLEGLTTHSESIILSKEQVKEPIKESVLS